MSQDYNSKVHGPILARTALIFDLDGTLYPYPSFKKMEIYEFYGQATTRAAQEIFKIYGLNFPWTSAEAQNMAIQGYSMHGKSVLAFYEEALRQGIEDALQLMDDLDAAYHIQVLEEINRRGIEYFYKNKELYEALHSLKEDVRYGVLTMSCPDRWVPSALSAIGIQGFFQEIIGSRHVGHISKKAESWPIEMALDRLGVQPSQAVFLEDSLANLTTAKEAYPDLLTVHVHHGTSHFNEKGMCGGDLVFDTSEKFLAWFKEARDAELAQHRLDTRRFLSNQGYGSGPTI